MLECILLCETNTNSLWNSCCLSYCGTYSSSSRHRSILLKHFCVCADLFTLCLLAFYFGYSNVLVGFFLLLLLLSRLPSSCTIQIIPLSKEYFFYVLKVVQFRKQKKKKMQRKNRHKHLLVLCIVSIKF